MEAGYAAAMTRAGRLVGGKRYNLGDLQCSLTTDIMGI
jgi:hypothetical protein